MKFLNKHSTAIFCRLVHAMAGRDRLEIESESFVPLTMQLIDSDIPTPWGIAKVYILAHYLNIDGQLRRDPEMGFLFIEKRLDTNAKKNVSAVFPYFYQQTGVAIYQECASFGSGQALTVNYTILSRQVNIANQWLMLLPLMGLVPDFNRT